MFRFIADEILFSSAKPVAALKSMVEQINMGSHDIGTSSLTLSCVLDHSHAINYLKYYIKVNYLCCAVEI